MGTHGPGERGGVKQELRKTGTLMVWSSATRPPTQN